MQFNQVLDAYRRVSEVDKACEREYRLSERAIVTITIMSFDGEPPRAHIRSFGVEYPGPRLQFLEPGNFTPGELRALAEIRHMLDAWMAGERPELPPSNSTRMAEVRGRGRPE